MIKKLIYRHNLDDIGEKLYLYGTTSKMQSTLCYLVNQKIYVKGFINDESAGAKLFNKKIFSLSEIEDDAVILDFDHRLVNDKRSVEYFYTMRELNKPIVIWGAGVVGIELYNLLKKDFSVIGFVDSDKNKIGNRIDDIQVYDREFLRNKEIILIEAGKSWFEIEREVSVELPELERYYVESVEEIDEYDKTIIGQDIVLPMSNISMLQENFGDKQFYLYGRDLFKAYECKSLLQFFDFNNVNIVAEDYFGENSNIIKHIEDILYDEEYLVILYEDDCEYLISRLKLLGLEEATDFVHIKHPSIFSNLDRRQQLLDYNLGYTYQMNYKIPGIYIYGDEGKGDSRKIVVLGGSTSDSCASPVESWVKFFYDKCKNSVIYNGSVCGYTSAQELIKLIRDIIVIKPDIVIAYDGVNDLGALEYGSSFAFPYIKQIFDAALGRITTRDITLYKKDSVINESYFEKDSIVSYEKNLQYMNAICEVNGIKFFSFIQPTFWGKETYINKHEIEIYEREKNMCLFVQRCKQLRVKAKEICSRNGFVTDLSNIFDEVDVYMDCCHVYENGNRIIAEKIYNTIFK